MNTVLVTGATGTVGAHVVRELRRRQTPVRAFVRDPEKANRLLGPEVELAVGDFGDPAALRAAVDGVERVFLACANHPQQVPWETAVMSLPSAPTMPRIFSMPAMKPSAGLPGVLGVLVVTSSPESSSNATTSVKVPPVSIPILIRRLLDVLWFDVLWFAVP